MENITERKAKTIDLADGITIRYKYRTDPEKNLDRTERLKIIEKIKEGIQAGPLMSNNTIAGWWFLLD